MKYYALNQDKMAQLFFLVHYPLVKGFFLN